VLSLCLILLAACGDSSGNEPIALMNQDGEEVTFPTSEPVLFFFMTTYT
jgi:hypothetical protein